MQAYIPVGERASHFFAVPGHTPARATAFAGVCPFNIILTILSRPSGVSLVGEPVEPWHSCECSFESPFIKSRCLIVPVSPIGFKYTVCGEITSTTYIPVGVHPCKRACAGMTTEAGMGLSPSRQPRCHSCRIPDSGPRRHSGESRNPVV